MTSIGTVEKGTVGELYVVRELLRNGAGVYLPVVDTKGIDAIVRKNDGTLLEIQIKTTFTEEYAGWFDVYDVDQYQEDRFVIVGVDIFSKEPPDVWILPAKAFIEYSNKAKMKNGSTLYRLGLESKSRKHFNQIRRDILKPDYLNKWEILTGLHSTTPFLTETSKRYNSEAPLLS